MSHPHPTKTSIHKSPYLDKTTTGNNHTPDSTHKHTLCTCHQLQPLMTYRLVLPTPLCSFAMSPFFSPALCCFMQEFSCSASLLPVAADWTPRKCSLKLKSLTDGSTFDLMWSRQIFTATTWNSTVILSFKTLDLSPFHPLRKTLNKIHFFPTQASGPNDTLWK